MNKVVLQLIALCLVSQIVCQSGIGDGLWRTFNLALVGLAPSLPLTSEEADSQGWKVVNSECDPNLGIQYAQNGATPQKNTPLTIYYTASGQVAGLGIYIYGDGSAPDNLVEKGFWIPVGSSEWMLSASFRGIENMCNSTYKADEVLGDRLVINQQSINYTIPLTAAEAQCSQWTPGSCMVTMGEHWFYDLSSAPVQSWNSSNLLPIVAMYYPPNINGTLSTFFFTTPVKQPGSNPLSIPGDWEVPALTPPDMCLNYCDSTCTWPGVDYWSTMHIYINSQWTYITCPNGSGPIDRECPVLDTVDCPNL